MLITLWKKECRQILKSLLYFLYIILFVLFMTSQLGDDDWTDSLIEPQKGQEDYGIIDSQDPEAVMQETLSDLTQDTYANSYTTYPMGFYKGVQLNAEELQGVQEILLECTGKDWNGLVEELLAYYDALDENSYTMGSSFAVTVKAELTYEEFNTAMKKVCDIVGKGSTYEESYYQNRTYVPQTYEGALQEYEEICNTDHVTGAYMRIFCDYAGIILALLPIFLGVSRCLRDKRAKAAEVIYSKSASAFQIIASRYAAAVAMVFIPVILTALLIQLPYQYRAVTLGITPDYLAFLKYTVVWLLPQIAAILAVSFLITEMTDGIAAIFIQAFWGIASLMGATTMAGDFKLHLVARWNTIGGTLQYMEQRYALYINRGYYAALAVLCIGLTLIIYEKKRKEGTTLYGKIRKAGR